MFPGILKTATLGYDGKGQQRVTSVEQALLAWMSMKQAPCVLEALIPFEREISVLVARGADGNTAVWPVQENQHVGGILDLTIVPARIDGTRLAEAQDLARRLVAAIDYVGVLCVEMFVTADGLLLNEIAPPAQQWALHHRGLRHLAVRAAGPHSGRGTAGRYLADAASGDGQSARRRVV